MNELLCRVSRLCRLIAILLLALWLPATLHCGLEAAGAIAGEGCAKAAEPSSAPTAHCEDDGCKTIEEGLYRPTTPLLKGAAAPVALCLCLIWQDTLEPYPVARPALSSASHVEPFEFTVPWQFVQRAAPLPGAPSFA